MTHAHPLILVVDDVATVRVSLSSILRGGGLQVAEATNGAEALAAVKENRPDLILMDIDMPEMDGFAALETLRQAHSKLELPVIMVTSSTNDEDVIGAFDHGANDYICKPVIGEILLARVFAQLEMQDLHRQLKQDQIDEAEITVSAAVHGGRPGGAAGDRETG